MCRRKPCQLPSVSCQQSKLRHHCIPTMPCRTLQDTGSGPHHAALALSSAYLPAAGHTALLCCVHDMALLEHTRLLRARSVGHDCLLQARSHTWEDRPQKYA